MACHPVIERYVADLSVRLPGPRRWRAAVLDEVRDCLLEGMRAHSGAASDPAAAVLRAVAEQSKGFDEPLLRPCIRPLCVRNQRGAAAPADR